MVAKDDILNDLELEDRAKIIQNGLNSDSGSSTRAHQEKRNYGLEGVINEPDPTTGRPAFTRDEFNALPVNVQNQLIEDGFGYRLAKRGAEARRALITRMDEALKDGVKYSSRLAELSNAKPVVEQTKGKDKDTLNLYNAYKRSKELAESADKRKEISREELEPRRERIQKSFVIKKREALIGKGYAIDAAKAMAPFLAASESVKDIPDDVLRETFAEEQADTEKELKKLAGDNYADRVSEIVGKAMEGMLKSTNPDKEKLAANLYYIAHKGYQIGERPFNVVYP